MSWLLPRLIGASRAYELMLTGRFVDATEAERIGLVTRVVPDGEVVAAAVEHAQLILANSPFGVQMTKEVMWSQLEVGSLAAGIDLENRTQLLAATTADLGEAMAAFVEKRPPSVHRRMTADRAVSGAHGHAGAALIRLTDQPAQAHGSGYLIRDLALPARTCGRVGRST